MQFVHDAYEMSALKIDLGINNPYEQVEIVDQFGFNCVKNYCWIIKKCFTKIDVLNIVMDDGNAVIEVLNMLRYSKVLLCHINLNKLLFFNEIKFMNSFF